MDLVDFAKQRLFEEMGLKVDELIVKNHFIYKAEFPNGLVEYELDYILLGQSDLDPILNPEEAQQFKWISLTDLKAQMEVHPQQFTFWLHEIFKLGMM